jgi:hypothetical protein
MMTDASELRPEDKAFEEGTKLFYDIFKHLTTLGTGSFLVLVTFFEKFQGLQHRWLATLGIAIFILMTMVSVFLMFFLARDVSIRGAETPLDRFFKVGAWIVSILLICGFISLGLFAGLNLVNLK